MKKKTGLVYYSLRRNHFCTMISENTYRDLTTGEEFNEADDAVRQVMPEDLLDATILVETTEVNKSHYIRLSYLDVATTYKVSDLISVDIDPNGKLIGIKLDYPWIGKH